jgi:hypothetical protein
MPIFFIGIRLSHWVCCHSINIGNHPPNYSFIPLFQRITRNATVSKNAMKTHLRIWRKLFAVESSNSQVSLTPHSPLAEFQHIIYYALLWSSDTLAPKSIWVKLTKLPRGNFFLYGMHHHW